jgi:hypothetical protein
MTKAFWDLMDIVVTLVLLGVALPIMANVTLNLADFDYHGFDTVQDKSLIQTDAELFDSEETTTYFTKFEIAGIFIVDQALDGELSRPNVYVDLGGTTFGPYGNGSVHVWDEGGHTTGSQILSDMLGVPEGRIFRMRDYIDPGSGQKAGVVFYD